MNDALRPADRPAQFAHLLAHSLSILGVALNGWRHPLPLPSPPTHAFFLRSWMELMKTGTHPFSCNGKSKEFSSGQALLCNNGERRKRNGKGEGERERVLRTMQRIFYDERTNERTREAKGGRGRRPRPPLLRVRGSRRRNHKIRLFVPPSLSH